MSQTLELPNDLAHKLAERAGQAGLELPEYAIGLLESACAARPTPAISTGAELVAYWRAEGLIGTRPDLADSAEVARQLRATAERRGDR